MSNTLRMTIEQVIAHNKRVKGIPADQPLATVKLGQAATYNQKPDYARILAQQIYAQTMLPQPILEFAFDKQLDGAGRGYQFDLCWPDRKLAFEVDGAVHRIKSRYQRDMAKHQAAVKLGYDVRRVSPAQVRNGEALELIRKALT